MPLFEYKCISCGLLDELYVPPGRPIPEKKTCPRCHQEAPKKEVSTFALQRSSMDNPPLDNLIGKDAETRWADIHHRQEIRDKVRKETGVAGLSMTGRNTFEPLKVEQKQLRTSLHEAIVERGGFPE